MARDHVILCCPSKECISFPLYYSLFQFYTTFSLERLSLILEVHKDLFSFVRPLRCLVINFSLTLKIKTKDHLHLLTQMQSENKELVYLLRSYSSHLRHFSLTTPPSISFLPLAHMGPESLSLHLCNE